MRFQPAILEGLAAQSPQISRFGFKVTDQVTLKTYPTSTFGNRAGRPNEHFLNAGLFASSFLAPAKAYARRWAS